MFINTRVHKSRAPNSFFIMWMVLKRGSLKWTLHLLEIVRGCSDIFWNFFLLFVDGNMIQINLFTIRKNELYTMFDANDNGFCANS